MRSASPSREMPIFAPNPNSYRRLRRHSDAPINTHWGRDNRTAGLRVPVSPPESRRVENRVPGSDANPYLAIAATLACGYLGMIGKMKPKPPVTGSAYKLAYTLPQHLPEALTKMSQSKPVREVLGTRFIDTLLGPAAKDTKARNEFLQIMRTQAERMSRLIDDLLSLSRIEQRRRRFFGFLGSQSPQFPPRRGTPPEDPQPRIMNRICPITPPPVRRAGRSWPRSGRRIRASSCQRSRHRPDP